MLCDEELNYCEKNPDTCQNGGKCISLESGDGFFKCYCQPGITGKRCEIVPELETPANATVTEETSSENLTVVGVETSSEVGSTEPNSGDNETE